MADVTVECLICDSLLEAARAQIAIHRLSKLLDGRDFPYLTPVSPGDRIGPDDGSTVEIKRHVRPYRLADGKIAVPITAIVRRLLSSGRLSEIADLTAAQKTRLLAIWQARRVLAENEVSDDQTGIDP